MTKVILLNRLKEFTEAVTKDIIMPISFQKTDTDDAERAAKIYLMRLPDSKSANKKAPYILHSVIMGKDLQEEGKLAEGRTVVRSIFCVYNENEQDGGMMLLNLMERVRVELLRRVVIGDQFELDLKEGPESLVYPDDTAPYFLGEMVSTWKMPPIKREVPELYGGKIQTQSTGFRAEVRAGEELGLHWSYDQWENPDS